MEDVQYGDVWASNDGLVTWRQVTAAAPWPPRSFHSAVVVQPTNSPSLCPRASKGEMLLLAAGGGNDGTFADVWRTCDGVAWTPVTLAAPWLPRIGTTINLVMTMVMQASAPAGSGAGVNVTHALVLAGGMSNLSTPGLSDVWRSVDYGSTWTMVATDGAGGFTPRSYHGAIAGPIGSRCPQPSTAAQHADEQHQQQEYDQQVLSSPLFLMGGWTVDVGSVGGHHDSDRISAPAAWRLHGPRAAASSNGTGLSPSSWYYVYFGDVYCADGGAFTAA